MLDIYRAGFSLRLEKWRGVTLNKSYSLLWGKGFVGGMAKRIREKKGLRSIGKTWNVLKTHWFCDEWTEWAQTSFINVSWCRRWYNDQLWWIHYKTWNQTLISSIQLCCNDSQIQRVNTDVDYKIRPWQWWCREWK